jgi:hypothetical protein
MEKFDNMKVSSGNRQINHSSKEEIIKALSADSELEGFSKFILILEHKKVSGTIGLITGELLQNNKIILRGKMTEFPESLPDSFNWDVLAIGESYFEGFSLDYQGEKISQLIIQGIKNSIKEGKIPFIR